MRQQTQKPKIFFVGSALALSHPSYCKNEYDNNTAIGLKKNKTLAFYDRGFTLALEYKPLK